MSRQLSLTDGPDRWLHCDQCGRRVGTRDTYPASTRGVHTDCWDGRRAPAGSILLVIPWQGPQ